ncbi:hypothetical protein J2046_001352 [Rhizobium petrolearium]|uniref:hypothetical protein n=1 Tax=Neorhizobium petrolearium TaxID=515361 RepID=UPI001AEAD44E|nr:hypothetical protein [Neorhizobium petrolearium]MBP1843098.1 hypothetical protein [Neorhizobium petrolearium]
MLLPTQQTYGLAATNVMQSMLDSIEEQRKEEEAERSGKERDPVADARISASEEAKRAREKITSALFGTNRTDPNELKIDLIDRLAKKLGLDTDEARSNYRLGEALKDLLKPMDMTQISKLEEDLGLKDIGISIRTLLAAIQNPYGDDNQRLMDAFTKKANGGKLGAEVDRVVQRLEDVADPKTLEELKLGPQGYDPTRVEDEETRAERLEDIEAAEAGKKLEDVQKVQDVIEKTNKNDGTDVGGDGKTDAASVDAQTLLNVFAAAADQVAHSDSAEPGRDTPAVDQAPSAEDQNRTSKVLVAGEAPASEFTADAVETLVEGQAVEETTAGEILPVRVDEIGIYELLRKKLAA